MTSRKNQQAARQYMREHDVPYMEALRRTASRTTPKPLQTSVPGRSPDEPLILGYTSPRHESSKPSLLGRFRKTPQQNPAPAPYVVGDGEADRARLVTVYGPVGTGKTMLLRSLLKQFRGHAAYVVHCGDLLGNPAAPETEQIGTWDGLIEVNLRPWLYGPTSPEENPAPKPPPIWEMPMGTLAIFDLGWAGRLAREGEASSSEEQRVVEAFRPWVKFQDRLSRMARSWGTTVATSVLTDDGPEALPLSLLQSPLNSMSVKVRMPLDEHGSVRHPRGGPWVYEVANPNLRSSEDFIVLTEQEARQYLSSAEQAG